MQYTIFGAGAIGGTVGAQMVRGGETVLFVDREPEHVRAMNERGLTIRGFDDKETFTVELVMDATNFSSRLSVLGTALSVSASNTKNRTGVVRVTARARTT